MKQKIDEVKAREWIDRFHHRANVMREIQSGKAEKNRRADLTYTFCTIVFGAILTFVAFSGGDRLSGLFGRAFDWLIHVTLCVFTDASTMVGQPSCFPQSVVDASGSSMSFFDFVFNSAVLLVFLASLLNLIFRWKEEHQALFQGVKRLTQYMHWLDELKLRLDVDVDIWIAKEVRMKYQVIVEQLPPNDEKDFQDAKKRLEMKAASRKAVSV